MRMAMAEAAYGSRRAGALLAAMAVAALSAACAVAPPQIPAEPPAASSAPAPVIAIENPPPRPAHKPSPPILAALPPAQETAPSPGPPEFDLLQGLDAHGTLALLGEPKQRAEAPPALLWRYASRDCELDVYFYLDLQSREMRVLHYEVRNTDDGNDRSQQRCYDELVTDRSADQAGSADRPR
jgi:hypothetical protein